ncbi:hypothetical protein BH09PSE2_BH09PSE2_08110 [soil metagenome]
MAHPNADEEPRRDQGGFQDGDNPPPPKPDVNEVEDEDGETPDREDELLDEGLEETFPASDPVSAKHIT